MSKLCQVQHIGPCNLGWKPKVTCVELELSFLSIGLNTHKLMWLKPAMKDSVLTITKHLVMLIHPTTNPQDFNQEIDQN